MGSAAACHVASRGKRVLGLERFTPAHNQGSSHGDSRIIRQAYHEHPSYVPLVQRAYELWKRLEQDTGTHLLHQTGGLFIGPPQSRIVEGAIRSANQHHLPHQVLNSQEINRRFPALHPRPADTAVYEEAAGYLRPEAAVQAHLELAAKHGAELHFEEHVIQWSTGTGVQVKTAKATYTADHLVIAPGAWAPELLTDLEIPFQIHRHVQCWFHPLSDTAALPIYIWDVDHHHCFYGFPATGSAAGGVKAALHSGGQPCTVHNVNRAIQEPDIQEVRACLERFIPSLNGPLVRAVTCLYTMTPDEHFIVARHPIHPQVSIAAGFSGHGFKFTSVLGEILSDLAIDGRTSHPIEFLSPARFLSAQ